MPLCQTEQNVKTSQVLYHELIRVIAEKYPDVHYDNVGYVFPPYVVLFLTSFVRAECRQVEGYRLGAP